MTNALCTDTTDVVRNSTDVDATERKRKKVLYEHLCVKMIPLI